MTSINRLLLCIGMIASFLSVSMYAQSAAQAVDGHPLLQAAAIGAARKARFTPTLLEGEPVKVTGVIQYNFASQ